MNKVAAEPRYRAFISYSHCDKRWADWLHRALEGWRAPRHLQNDASNSSIPERLAPIFRDRDELPSATDLGATVKQALRDSANLIVICSPHAAQSRWVNEEVRAFKLLGRSERIFCLIVDGEPNASTLPGREAEECFVPALRCTLDARGELGGQPVEPMAADLRPGRDGKTNALLKLIAGMLGLDFDSLKQREHRRHVRHMTVITAAALLLVAVTSGLAINAMFARHDASLARQAAEQRQNQAEELVNFMLGDFNDKLREVNRLDMLQTVNAQAMAYFASLPNDEAADATLQSRASALQRIGSVRMDQGRSEAALQAFRAASTIDAVLLQRAPEDIARQANYAHGLNWIGNAFWYRGDLDQALRKFEAATATLQGSAAAHPELAELQFKLASARTNTGRVLEARGELDEAKKQYLAVLHIFEHLAEADPKNTRWASELGYAYNNLGKLAQDQGYLKLAIKRYLADRTIKAALAAREPNNNKLIEALVLSNAILGKALARCGETTVASRFVAAAVKGAQGLMAFDPKHTGYRHYVADYSRVLAGLSRQQNDFAGAAQLDQRALRILATLIVHDQTNMTWHQSLALAQLEAARLALAAEHPTQARTLANASMQSIHRVRTTQPESQRPILIEAQGYQLLGQIAAVNNDAAAARGWWLKARAALQPVAVAGTDPNYLDAWASISLLLGDKQRAQPVINRLWNSGYRDPDFVTLVETAGIPYPINASFAQGLKETMQ